MGNTIKKKNSDRLSGQQKPYFASYETTMKREKELLSQKIEVRYRSFFENIEQAYFEIDKSGNLTFFNDYLCEMLGYSNDELAGKNFIQFLDKESSEKVIPAFDEIFETGKPKNGFTFQIVRKDGRKRQIGTSICLNMDSMNQKTGFRGIARDISERKNHEEQLNQTRRLESIGQLAAGIAHEINTPVQYIGDNIQFLKDAYNDITDLLKKVLSFVEISKAGSIDESIANEVDRLIIDTDADYLLDEVPKAIEQSIEGLKRVSGIVSAIKQFCHPGIEEKRLADINKSIENVIIVTRNEWKYIADVISDLDKTLPPVPCILGEINQVVLNLIINAVHAIESAGFHERKQKGIIKISTSHDDSFVEIRVSDTGTGIPEDIRNKIFDPFFTTKEVGKGSGQGLAISHSLIVNNHGGTLEFETEEGKGTEMIVRLPLGGDDE